MMERPSTQEPRNNKATSGRGGILICGQGDTEFGSSDKGEFQCIICVASNKSDD